MMKKILISLVSLLLCAFTISNQSIKTKADTPTVIDYTFVWNGNVLQKMDTSGNYSTITNKEKNDWGITWNGSTITLSKSLKTTNTNSYFFRLDTGCGDTTIIVVNDITLETLQDSSFGMLFNMLDDNTNLTIKSEGKKLTLSSADTSIDNLNGKIILDGVKIDAKINNSSFISNYTINAKNLELKNGASLKTFKGQSFGPLLVGDGTPTGVTKAMGANTPEDTLIDAEYDAGAQVYKISDGEGGTIAAGYVELNVYPEPEPSPTPSPSEPVVKDESCEKVIGPTWHWNNTKGICEEYSTVGTSTR